MLPSSGGGRDEEWTEEILFRSSHQPAGDGAPHQPQPPGELHAGSRQQQVEAMEHQHGQQPRQSRQSRQQSGGGLGQAEQDQVGGDGRSGGPGNTGGERRPERSQHREQSQSELGGFELGNYFCIVCCMVNIFLLFRVIPRVPVSPRATPLGRPTR